MQNPGIDLHDVHVSIAQHVMMRIDRRLVAVHNHGIKVEVLQAPDGVELIVVQIHRRHANRRRRGRRRRRDEIRQRDPRPSWRRHPASGIRARGNTHVQRIDETMPFRIVNSDLSGRADRRSAQKADDEMRIGIDAGSMIRRIHSDDRFAPLHNRQTKTPTTQRQEKDRAQDAISLRSPRGHPSGHKNTRTVLASCEPDASLLRLAPAGIICASLPSSVFDSERRILISYRTNPSHFRKTLILRLTVCTKRRSACSYECDER